MENTPELKNEDIIEVDTGMANIDEKLKLHIAELSSELKEAVINQAKAINSQDQSGAEYTSKIKEIEDKLGALHVSGADIQSLVEDAKKEEYGDMDPGRFGGPAAVPAYLRRE